MMDEQTIRNLSFFAGLKKTTLQKLMEFAREINLAPKQVVLLEGEPADAVYFVLEGEVKVYRMTSDGREQVLTRLKRGKAFNTVPPLLAKPCNHSSVETVSKSKLAYIQREDYLHIINTCPDFALLMLQDFASRLTQLTDMVENFALHSVRGRLAGFLISQADIGTKAGRFTQDEIAREIGTVRDVVGRLLKSFSDEGYIRREGRKVILLDRARLESEAES